jgi:hypothetical protein
LKSDSKEDTKISYVQVRLSERERKQVLTTAKKLDVSMSELIRQLIKEKHTEVEGQLAMFKKGK